MGISPTKEEQQDKKIEHSRVHTYKIVCDKEHNNKRGMLINFPIYTQKEFEDWERDKGRIQGFNTVLFFPEKYQLEQDTICGTTGNLQVDYPNINQMLFDFYPFILEEQILNRNKINTPFNQQEIWYLLYELVFCSKQFQKRGMKSGDIRPKNVLINEEGQIKLINRYTFPSQPINYAKSFQEKTTTYLSPEQLTELQKNVTKPTVNQVISQTFSIGLTILDVGLLFNSQTLYDMNYLTFKSHIFNDNLDKWKNSNYSHFLIKTVLNMLEINFQERPTPGEIHAILQPYEDKIRSLIEFIPSKELSKKCLEAYQNNNTLHNKSPVQNKIEKTRVSTGNGVNNNTNNIQQFRISNEYPIQSQQPSIRSNQMIYSNSLPKVIFSNNQQAYQKTNYQQIPPQIIYTNQAQIQHQNIINSQQRVVPNSKAYLQQPDPFELRRY